MTTNLDQANRKHYQRSKRLSLTGIAVARKASNLRGPIFRDSDITKEVMAEVDKAITYWRQHGPTAALVARGCELRGWTRDKPPESVIT